MQPIVNIDGDKIRRVREAQGLTQLYLATVVSVTTDTISRWENKRSPTIRRDNALKLAEALGVELEELLTSAVEVRDAASAVGDEATLAAAPAMGENGLALPGVLAAPRSVSAGQDAVTPPPAEMTSRPGLLRRCWPFGVLAAAIVCLLPFLGRLSPGLRLEAERIAPGHVAPDSVFPVLVRIRGRGEQRLPVMIREALEGRCDSFGLEDSAKRYGKTPRWIGRVENGAASFVYLVHPAAELAPGDGIGFSGEIITREGKGSGRRVSGPDRIAVMPFHWADADRDYRITDDEVLAVYDTYVGSGQQQLPLHELEQLWLAGAYSWDGRNFSPGAAPEKTEGERQ